MEVPDDQPISQKNTVRGVVAERRFFISKFAFGSQGETPRWFPEFMVLTGTDKSVFADGGGVWSKGTQTGSFQRQLE